MQSSHFPGQPAEGSILNTALLDQYRSRKSNLLERLINAYLEEAPKSFQALRKAVEAGDLEGVRMNAHALKSTSYNLGAMRLSKMCQEIEVSAARGNENAIADVMTRIGPECFDVEQALCSELYQLKKKPETYRAPETELDDDWN